MNSQTILGLFNSETEAEVAITALVDSGVQRSRLTLMRLAPTSVSLPPSQPGSGSGFLSGSIIGLVEGAVLAVGVLVVPGTSAFFSTMTSAAITGAIAGCVGGGLIGLFVGGLRREDPRAEEDALLRRPASEAGIVVMALVAGERAALVRQVFREQGAKNVEEEATLARTPAPIEESASVMSETASTERVVSGETTAPPTLRIEIVTPSGEQTVNALPGVSTVRIPVEGFTSTSGPYQRRSTDRPMGPLRRRSDDRSQS